MLVSDGRDDAEEQRQNTEDRKRMKKDFAEEEIKHSNAEMAAWRSVKFNR